MGRSVEDARAGYVVVGSSGVLAPVGAALRSAGHPAAGISRGSRLEQGDWDERVALDARDPDAVASWLATRDLLPHTVFAYAPATSPEAFARLADGCEVAVLVVPSAWSDPVGGDALAASWQLADDVRVLRLGWTGDPGSARWHTPEEISAAALALALDPASEEMLGRVRPWDERPGAPVVREEPWPSVTGGVGFAQGVYGDQGNLELVAADAAGDGIWVGWWNADDEDHRAGAVPGSWSGAKRFADGHEYVQVSITQAVAGPSFLEVLALSPTGDLDRHVWTPTDGFTRHGTLLHDVVAAAPLVVDGQGDHWVVASTTDGPVVLHGRPDAAYPVLELEPVQTGVAALALLPRTAWVVGATWHTDHLDLLAVDAGNGKASGVALWCCGATDAAATLRVDGDVTTGSIAAQGNSLAVAVCAAGRAVLVLLAGPPAPTDLGPAENATVTPVQVGPDRAPEWHVVTTHGTTATHHRHRADGAAVTVPQPVAARAWATPDTSSLHGHL